MNAISEGMMGIFIVEDESITAMYMEAALQSEGFTVSGVFSTGEEAVDYAAKEKPALLLMDIRLAGDIDGIETARRILSLHKVPIIFMTAFSDEKTKTRALELNPIAWLTKPFGPSTLVKTIRPVLSPDLSA